MDEEPARRILAVDATVVTTYVHGFEGLELLGPGVVPVSGWRPGPGDVAAQAQGIVPVCAGVARRP